MLGFSPLAASPIAATGVAGEEYVFAVNEGTFTLTGQDVTLLKSVKLDAQAGLITLSLQGASKLITEFVPDGQFSTSGSDVNFLKALNIDAANGSFVLTGQNVDLTKSVIFDELVDNDFLTTGQDINFGFGFAALAGSFALTGQEITEDITDVVASGSFSVTFQDANVIAQRILAADNGSFSYQVYDIDIRGFFEVDPLPEKTYTEQIVAAEIWLDTTDPDADDWPEVSEPTDIWTETTDVESETWTEAA